ncbi:MAG TPA: response regulator transcription factor [Lacibacter sp.]|nr:response regulator transcription factor [Lacibacter sp.]
MNLDRIIVADDHAFVRMGIVQILKDEFPSSVIQEAKDGTELLQLVLEHNWDLVISDLDMPGKTGLEVLEQLKLNKPSTPVIILSIYAEELYAVRAMKAGASAYLNKSTAPYELIKAIERIRLGRKYITEELAEKLLNLDDHKTAHEKLTNREMEIFKMLASGKSVSQIADTLSLALTTVSTHRSHILEKLGLSSNADLVRYALSHGLLSDLK